MRRRYFVPCTALALCLGTACGSSNNGPLPGDAGDFDGDAWFGSLHDAGNMPPDAAVQDTRPSQPDSGDASQPGSKDGAALDASDAGVSEPSIVTVQLSASSARVTAAGTITLTATATSDRTIGKIEFYEGATLLGTKNASPASITVGFVEGDNGSHTYTAKAYTPNSSGTSAAVAVDVAIAPDPCGVDKSACVGDGCAPTACLSPSHIASGFGAFSRSRGIADSTFTGAVAFDTKSGAVGTQRTSNADPTIYEVLGGIGFVRIAQSGSEPPLAIWIFQSATFDGAIATFTGDAAAILAASHDMTVKSGSSFDVSAKARVPGPGGFLGGTYAANGLGCAYGTGSAAGGGGAGFGTDGATGGSGAGGLATNCAGAYGDLVSLRGGSGGGGGDDSSSAMDVRFGGAGGGALQLSALGNLKFDGVVSAGGGGGRTSEGNSRSGAGAGSGGGIYLESPAITLGATAGLYANGGGGGSSSPGTGGSCGSPAASEDGQASLIAAKGSHCGGGYGGNGAAGTVGSTAGTSTGGGGGGLGRIVLRTLPTSTPGIATSNLSPDATSASFRILKTLGQ